MASTKARLRVFISQHMEVVDDLTIRNKALLHLAGAHRHIDNGTVPALQLIHRV